MTSGLTNRPIGGDPAIQAQLCTPDVVATTLSGAAAEPVVYANADSWRVEVAARLERYRTRRKPRTPRYPSLLLPFDAPDTWSRPAPTALETLPAPAITELPSASPSPAHIPGQTPEPYANVIEFPRSAAIPVFHPGDLADPVFDRARPRIVEAPEILPPPPALGGMLIEPAHLEPADSRLDPPSAPPTASITRRALAALVDGLILSTALAGFTAIFLRVNPLRVNPDLNSGLGPIREALPTFAAALVVVAALLWAAYEFLFVVYTGSTPGLRAARLHLTLLDGSPLHRRARRWRVLASFLSAFSAGLGYLWCFLDQDGLCWHDRITRTRVQSVAQAE